MPMRRVIITIPEELLQRITAAAERDKSESYGKANFSEWVRQACIEKLERRAK